MRQPTGVEKKSRAGKLVAPRLSKRSETGCEIWYVIEYKRCPVSGATGGRCGGAGGGIRTHKGLRPEMYQISGLPVSPRRHLTGCEPRQSTRPRRET